MTENIAEAKAEEKRMNNEMIVNEREENSGAVQVPLEPIAINTNEGVGDKISDRQMVESINYMLCAVEALRKSVDEEINDLQKGDDDPSTMNNIDDCVTNNGEGNIAIDQIAADNPLTSNDGVPVKDSTNTEGSPLLVDMVSEVNETEASKEENAENQDCAAAVAVDLRDFEINGQYYRDLSHTLDLDSERQSALHNHFKQIESVRKEYEDTKVENQKLRKRIQQLEQQLNQTVMFGGGEMHPAASKSKQDQGELLLKAKSLLFENTKVIKQQEQQISVLKNHVEALKEVALVRKDMLMLMQSECAQTEARVEQHAAWIKTERDKNLLLEKKLDISKQLYTKLKTEHEVQSKIFRELRETYLQEIKVLTDALQELKKK